LYDFFKLKLSLQLKRPLNSAEYFFVGLFVKFIATIVTYPIQVLQNIFRFKKLNSFKQSIKKYGVFAFYRGLGAKLVHTTIMSGFHMAFYEKIRNFIVLFILFFVRKKSSSQATFSKIF